MSKKEKQLEEFIHSIDRNKFQFVYSPAHIEEIAFSTVRNKYPFEKTKEKLSFISELTNNIEILPSKRNDVRIIEELGAYLCEEHPESCYIRVSENYHLNEIVEEIQQNFLKEVTEKNIYDNNPKNMNNISPENALSTPIHDLITKKNIFLTLLSTGRYNKDQIRKIMGCSQDLKEFTFPLIKKDFKAMQIAMEIVFNKLEEIRYHPEKTEKYRSRLHDISHAIYAVYCDYFVTKDAKLLNKAKAAYSYLKQETIATTIEGLQSIVSDSSLHPSQPN